MILEYTDVFRAGLAENMLRSEYLDATLVLSIPKPTWTEWKIVHELRIPEEHAIRAEQVLAKFGLMGIRS